MRLVFRILGTDVFELATGRDAIEAVAGSVAADLSAASPAFGVHGHDEQWTFEE